MQKKKCKNIVFCIAVSTFMITACAAPQQPEEEPSGSEETAGKIEYPEFPFDFVSPESSEELKNMEFPEKLDLREYGLVTPVRLQNPFGTCWGFAAAAAAEISLLGSGMAQQDGYDASTLNLSEKHLAYFVAKELDDPSSPQNGEGLHSKEDVTAQERMNIGGLPFNATSTFSSGIGPVHENRDEMFEYHGANMWTEKRMIDGRFQDFSYSGDDDWSLPEEERFRQSYVLKESYIVPSPARIETGEDGPEYSYNELGTLAIKEQLMNKRGVMIGFCADTSKPDQDDSTATYISKNWAHYTFEPVPGNHAVCIVGWDDTYPKENFIEGHQPPENGAWLVKNSWGSGEVDFPDKGEGIWGIENEEGVHTGYFWLSYYDQSIAMPEALVFDHINYDAGYYLDEHDLMPASEIKSATTEQEMKMANVFEAQECETLEEVSCQTSVPGTKVTYEVYLLVDEFTDPENGIKVGEETAEYRYGGFHKVKLSKPVQIQKGHYYSIIVTQQTPDGKYTVNVPCDQGSDEFNNWNVAVVNERESWIYADEYWGDYANDDRGIRELSQDPATLSDLDQDRVWAYDNFPIKGFCTLMEKNLSTRIDGTGSLIMYKDQGETDLKVRFIGDEGVYPDDDAVITWEIMPGGEKIIKLEPENNGATAHITQIGEGSTYVTCTVTGIGTTVVQINAARLSVISAEINEDADVVYTGEEIRPKVLVTNIYSEEIKESEDYELSYSDNIKCGIAKIKATGINSYKDETETYFPIVPAKAVIKSVKAKGATVTVTLEDQSESGLDGYKVRLRAKGTKEWTTVKVPASKTTAEFTKLKKGTEYEVKACGYIDTEEEAGMYWGIETEYTGAYSDTVSVTCK